jgi:hypothetical protein
MGFVDPTKPYRKSGGMGHPRICCTFRGLTSSSALNCFESLPPRLSGFLKPYFFMMLRVMLEGYWAEWWTSLWATLPCDSL